MKSKIVAAQTQGPLSFLNPYWQRAQLAVCSASSVVSEQQMSSTTVK